MPRARKTADDTFAETVRPNGPKGKKDQVDTYAFGKALDNHCHEKCLTDEYIARVSGLSGEIFTHEKRVNALREGRAKGPQAEDDARRIAEALGIPLIHGPNSTPKIDPRTLGEKRKAAAKQQRGLGGSSDEIL